MLLKIFFTPCLLSVILLFTNPQTCLAGLFSDSKTLDTQNALIYLPDAIIKAPQTYFPIVVVFPPSGNPNDSFDFWKQQADKHGFAVYSSKIYHNDMFEPELEQISVVIYNDIRDFINSHNLDTSKIIFTGLSGGGGLFAIL